MNAVGFRIRIIRTYDEIGGVARSGVRAGLEQLFEVGFQAAISLAEYL